MPSELRVQPDNERFCVVCDEKPDVKAQKTGLTTHRCRIFNQIGRIFVKFDADFPWTMTNELCNDVSCDNFGFFMMALLRFKTDKNEDIRFWLGKIQNSKEQSEAIRRIQILCLTFWRQLVCILSFILLRYYRRMIHTKMKARKRCESFKVCESEITRTKKMM